jgi:hypothetical protein
VKGRPHFETGKDRCPEAADVEQVGEVAFHVSWKGVMPREIEKSSLEVTIYNYKRRRRKCVRLRY